ncbi:flagellar biosynthesis repressor FlbT [Pedomonas mirosovicensis]|uniref:flagellar biosynthesis repressor FlbT n=1 Tax=Pedomonas mirosovicensis TaxID=2908641 RepID=UPI002169AA43|nr:flagellar biosynthesis repressor FlbT [Pedomonas mirosovicensis]MCH8685092.1 flagellar biosynthesis repressor FlbT [Pedomonas mirosovicensis]
MALKISLKPGEKFVVNGAVLTNGDRRSTFVIQNKVSILRERDIMTEEQANTPAKRIYFVVMLSYLDSERAKSYYQTFVERMSDFMGAIQNQEIKLICVQISMDMMRGEYYRALTGCRKIVEYETKVLGVFQDDVAASLP